MTMAMAFGADSGNCTPSSTTNGSFWKDKIGRSRNFPFKVPDPTSFVVPQAEVTVELMFDVRSGGQQQLAWSLEVPDEVLVSVFDDE